MANRTLLPATLLLAGCLGSAGDPTSPGGPMGGPEGQPTGPAGTADLAGSSTPTGGADLGGGDAAPGTGPFDLGPIQAGVPGFADSSHGTGGARPVNGTLLSLGGISYYLLAPPASGQGPLPLLVFICGVTGCAPMVATLDAAGGLPGLDRSVRVLFEHTCAATQIASVMDDLRAHYDIDNDRTYLESESAGTITGIDLGFGLRQGWFAAYWLNDLVTSGAPAKTAAQIGFQPWGSAGPGGNVGAAQAVVAAMESAGYRLPTPKYYDGPGYDMHGSSQQGLASLMFFGGKSRR